MKKEDKRRIKKVLLISSAIIVLAIIGYYAVSQSLLYSGPIPGHIYAGGTYSSYVCGRAVDKYSSIYMSMYGDYKVKANVATLTTSSQWEDLGDSREFIMSVWLGRYWVGGFTPSYHSIDEGLPPQVKCDGTLDCNYGYTDKQWELKEGKCFAILPKISVYRLEDNKCNDYEIFEKDKVSTDYTQTECNSKIISYIDIYRLEDNECVKYNINEEEKLTSDYLTISECQTKIISYIDVYRLENNICNKYQIDEKDKLTSDFNTLQECSNQITIPDKTPDDDICCGTPGGPYVLEETCSRGSSEVPLSLCDTIVGTSCGTVSPDSRDECCIDKGFDFWSGDSCEYKEIEEPNFIIKFWNWIKSLFS